MATSWGPFEGGVRVGINVVWEAVTTGETAATATIYIYTDNDQTFNDSQTLSYGGSISGSTSFTNNESSGSGATLRATKSYTYTYTSTQYGSSPGNKTFTASASGLYTGGTPSESVTSAIPERPYATPNPPTNAAASRSSETTATITWTRNETAQRKIGTHWLYESKSGGAFTLITTGISASATSINRAVLTNTKYRFAVAADNSVGTSAYDETQDYWTSPAAPSAPVRTDIAGPAQRISWNNKTTGYTEFHTEILGYKNGVYVGVLGTDTNQVLNAARTFDHTAANVVSAYTAGDKWKYAVRHKTTSGTQGVLYSTSNDVTSETPGVTSAPSAPTNLFPDALAIFNPTQTITFTWQHNPTDSTAQVEYQFQWRIGAGAWTTLAAVASGASTYVAPIATFPDLSTIGWQVRTKGSNAAFGPYSAEAFFKTVGDPNAQYINKRAIRRNLDTGRDETAPVGALTPIGAVMPFAGAAAPPGWLLCQGQSLLRADYIDLFGVIGTTYGAVDGTHFTLPDVQDRFPVGKSGTKALGSTGGAESVVLVAANLPAHAHAMPHTHGPGGADQFMANDTAGTANRANGTSVHMKGIAATGQPSTPNTGNGPGTATAVDIKPKYIAFNYIIKI